MLGIVFGYVFLCLLSVSSFPSSAIMLYSSSLLPLACLLASNMQFGSVFALLMSSHTLFSVCSASFFLCYPLFVSLLLCISLVFFFFLAFCDIVQTSLNIIKLEDMYKNDGLVL